MSRSDFAPDQTRRFLQAILDPSIGCCELRVFHATFERGGYIVAAQQYSRTFAGWYDDASKLIADLGRLRGVSGYVTLNPIRSDLMARSDSQLTKAKHTTTDADIVCLRWLYIDIDPIRPADISATDDELVAAVRRRDDILSDHPDLAARSIWGRSGNGTWILVRLPDYPNDQKHHDIITRALTLFSVRYTDSAVKVDPTTKNPSRVMCVPGTLKAKGSNRPERPWRLATIDSPERSEPIEGFDLEGWNERHALPDEPTLTLVDQVQPHCTNGDLANGVTHNGDGAALSTVHVNGHHDDRSERIRRGASYLDSIPPAISGQGGHNQTFDAACALIKGFDLTIDEARPILEGWNNRCLPPWAAIELEHKLLSADEKTDDKPRGYLFHANRITYPGLYLAPVVNGSTADANGNEYSNGYHNGTANGHANSNDYPPDAGGVVAVADPDEEFEFTDMGNAQRLIKLFGNRIRYCKAYGDWLIYEGRRWIVDNLYQIESMAQQVPAQVLTEIPPTSNEETIKSFRKWSMMSQSRAAIANLIQSARSRVAVTPNDLDRDPWLLNVQNGTINLQTGEFRSHRPSDMITRLAPVVYDPMAEAPTWDRFVLEIMNDDPDLVDYLRRAVGYSVTGIIRQHVFFCCYGTGANGKTTFFKTLAAILGDYANEIDSDLLVAQGLAQHPTGLTELEGRRLIVAEETEDSRRLAEAMVKKLTGGNPIQARKMHKDFYTFLPSHHLFLATNHKPEIRGMDPGIWRRIKLVPFEVSFDPKVPGGRKPDLGLDVKLAAEAPGILNWLLQGCRDWQERGLIEPEVIRTATQDYREEMDFLGWFLEERCTAEEDARIVLSVLYGEYVAWCGLANTNPLGIRKFSSQLTDKGYTTKKTNSIVSKLGLRLKTEGEKIADSRDDGNDVPF